MRKAVSGALIKKLTTAIQRHFRLRLPNAASAPLPKGWC